MPFLEGLDFVGQDAAFEVSYRASAESQELDIEVETAGKTTRRSGPVCLRKVIDMINFGAAGGATFAPELGRAERLRGPWDGADAFGPVYHWTLRIAAVDPIFFRLVIEHLRRCGWDQAVRSMRLRGELASNRSPQSVMTDRARVWLEDERTYPGLWPSAPFVLTGHEVANGASVRVEFADAPDAEIVEALQMICARWLQATATIIGSDGEPVIRTAEQIEQMLPAFAMDDRVFTAELKAFGHAAQPAAAILSNMLVRFHAAQAELRSVDIGILGLGGWPARAPTATRPIKPVKATAKKTAKRKPSPSKSASPKGRSSK